MGEVLVQDVSVGVDIIEIERIAATLERFGARFLERVYTAGEIAYCHGRAPLQRPHLFHRDDLHARRPTTEATA